MNTLFSPDPWVRVPLYIALGLVAEVLFTGVVDLAAPMFLQSWNAKNLDRHPPAAIQRDPRAMGYTFLWMIPIYTLLILIEPISQQLHDWPLGTRGLVYLGFFWLFEYLGGAGIKKITGYDPWDYSYSRFSLHGHIRWDFAPVWYTFSLIVEWFSHKFILLTPALKGLWG